MDLTKSARKQIGVRRMRLDQKMEREKDRRENTRCKAEAYGKSKKMSQTYLNYL